MNSRIDDADAPAREPLLIPDLLRGRRRDVTTRCRRLVSRAVKANGWPCDADAGAMSDVFGHGGAIVFGRPVEEDGDDTTTLLYALGEQLTTAAARDDYARLAQVERLVLAGMDRFWVSLAAIGSPPRLLPRSRDAGRERAFALAALTKLVRWWEPIGQLEARYLGSDLMPQPWPLWGRQALSWCREAGMAKGDVERLASIPARDAGARILAWVGDAGRTGDVGSS